MPRLRKMTSATNSKPVRRNAEPLAESIIPLDKRGRRAWSKMGDTELVEYGQNFIDNNKMKHRVDLQNKDHSLYNALTKRKLLDRIKFEWDERAWRRYSDDELVAYTQKLVKRRRTENRYGLIKEDSGLCSTLRKRKLFYRIEFKTNRGKWNRYTSDELIAYAQGFINERKIKNKNDLRNKDGRLYFSLWRRKLIDKLLFKYDKRAWRKYSDNNLITYAQRFIDKKGIKNRNSLENADPGLCQVLRKRKLLDRIKFEVGRRKCRDWATMSDDAILIYARGFIEDKGIENRESLKRQDSGLYETLRKRNILGLVFAPIERGQLEVGIGEIIDALAEFQGEAA